MRARAHELGAVMSNEGIKSFDAFGDKLSELSSAFTGAVTNIASGFLPLLQDTLIPLINNALIPAMQSAANMIRSVVDAFVALPAPIQVAIGVVAGIVAAIGPLALAIGGVITLLPMLTAGLAPLAAGMAAINLPVLAVTVAVVGLTTAWMLFSDKIIQFGGAVIDILVREFNRFLGFVNSIGDSLNNVIGTFVDVSLPKFKLIDQEGKTLGTRFIETIGGMDNAVRNWGTSMDTVPPKLAAAAASTTQVAGAVANLTAATQGYELAVKRLPATIAPIIPQIRTLEISTENIAQSSGNFQANAAASTTHITQMAAGAARMKEAFAQMAVDLLSGNKFLGDMKLNAEGIQNAFSSFSSLVTSGERSKNQKIEDAILTGPISLIPGIGKYWAAGVKTVAKFFGFQHGGIAMQPMMGTFAEHGPEAVIPLDSPRANRMLGGGYPREIRVVLEMDGNVVGETVVDIMRRKGIV